MNPAAGSEDPRDWLVEQGYERYTDADHATWHTLAARQREVLQNRIVPKYFDGLDRLGIAEAGIPDFRAMNGKLRDATGWEVVAVPGLVPDIVFFKLLASRRFPAGHWIRKPEQLDYIEEPDIFHDVFGHVPLIADQGYADYLEAFGRAGLIAAERNALPRMARLYWYTVEFGLAQTPQGLRIVGAGIASSPSETVFALESPSPNRIGFDLGRVMRTLYRIDDFQETYFVLDGPDAWPELDLDRLAVLWGELDRQPEIGASEILAADRVISRGDRSYHEAKARSAA